MKPFVLIGGLLVATAFGYLGGIEHGVTQMCRQMGFESAKRSDSAWACVKTTTVVMVPGRDR